MSSRVQILLCLSILIFHEFGHGLKEDLTPFIKMNLVEMIQHYNYSITDYNVTTADGYILQVFRLQNTTTFNQNLYPVLFFHGLTGCANNWVLLGRQSLVFILADLGYDVWLLNARGTFYGRRHVSLNPKSPNFWTFSWHEIAIYDMPASIDVALSVTGLDKVAVISHSEGTTYFMAMVADFPEYDNKVAVGILMGPGVFFRNPRVPLWRTLSGFHRLYQIIGDALQINSITPNTYSNSLPLICNPRNLVWPVCKNLLATFLEDPDQLQPDVYEFMLSKVPCGGSLKEIIHFLQNIASGDFNHFDYGAKKNLVIYNSTIAPPYPLERVRTKIIILHGPLDYMASTSDVKLLVSKLSNVVHVESPKNGNWSHVDYLMAKDAYQEAYVRIISFLRRINRNNVAMRRSHKKT